MRGPCPCGKKGCDFVIIHKCVDSSPDLRYKENRLHFLPPNTNLNGSLDMRKLSNRKKNGLIISENESD